jgi:hypothetical protein
MNGKEFIDYIKSGKITDKEAADIIDGMNEEANKMADRLNQQDSLPSDLSGGLVAWSKDRRMELNRLLDVILTISNLNCGSDFLGKTEECIQEALLLSRGNINTGRESLTQFLIAKASGN